MEMSSKFLGYSAPKSPAGKPVKVQIKAVKVGNSIRMTIPQEFCTALEINAGDTLTVYLNGRVLQVKKG